MRSSLKAVIWRGSRGLAASPWLVQSVAHKAAECNTADPAGSNSWAAAAACIVAAGVTAAATASVAHAEAFEAQPRSPEELRADFMAWIRKQGGHMDGVTIANSKQVGPQAGRRFETTRLSLLPDVAAIRWNS